MFLYRKYIYIESISIFEKISMFENFVLVQSVKGSGKCAHFPVVALMLLRGRRFRDLLCWSCSPLLPKIFINKLPSPLVLSASRKNITKLVYLTPTVNVGKMLYLYSIIKKATKKIENLFCSLPNSANVPLHCCG